MLHNTGPVFHLQSTEGKSLRATRKKPKRFRSTYASKVRKKNKHIKFLTKQGLVKFPDQGAGGEALHTITKLNTDSPCHLRVLLNRPEHET